MNDTNQDRLFIDPFPPSELMTKVGNINTVWQMTEVDIEQSIWGLANLDEIAGRSFTAHMSVPLKCDVLRSLYHAKFQDKNADSQLTKLIEKELKPAHNIRNRYAHALWLRDEKGRSVLLEKTERGKPYVSPRIVSEPDLQSELTTVLTASMFFRFFLMGEANYQAVPIALIPRLPSLKPQAAPAPIEFHRGPTIPDKPQYRPLPSEESPPPPRPKRRTEKRRPVPRFLR